MDVRRLSYMPANMGSVRRWIAVDEACLSRASRAASI